MADPQLQQVLDEVRRQISQEATRPLVVAVLGQTGVGKSSLINALFGTTLRTDPVRPCTKVVERVVARGPSGHEMHFLDMPGLGEATVADTRFLADYEQCFRTADVVLWALHADNRSIAFDQLSLSRLLERFPSHERGAVISKISFVLTKVDLLAPPPWIFGKLGATGIFSPPKPTSAVIAEKCRYFRDAFLRPYADTLLSETYNDGFFRVAESEISADEDTIRYQGYLGRDRLDALCGKYPKHAAAFTRLADNQGIVPTSARFRFNLLQLMLVVVNKLGRSAIERFSNFLHMDSLNTLPVSDAVMCSNIVVFDRVSRRVVFDLKDYPME